MITPFKISGTGTGGSVDVYTVLANQSVEITASNFANTTSGNLTAIALANDGTDRQLFTKSISGNSDYQPPSMQGIVLAAGNILKINADALIDWWVSGVIFS